MEREANEVSSSPYVDVLLGLLNQRIEATTRRVLQLEQTQLELVQLITGPLPVAEAMAMVEAEDQREFAVAELARRGLSPQTIALRMPQGEVPRC